MYPKHIGKVKDAKPINSSEEVIDRMCSKTGCKTMLHITRDILVIFVLD